MFQTNQYEDEYPVNKGFVTLENLKILRGANYFSGGPVVLMRINLNEYDEVFTNSISGFYEKLKTILPSLIEHHCSEGRRGGFFLRVEQGTLLGHVIEHIAIELQTLAGMDVGYGKTRSTLQQGVYNVVFRFFDEIAGITAGKAALNIVNSILVDKKIQIEEIIQTLIQIREDRMLGPSTQAIVAEAEKRQIPVLRLDEYNFIQLGTGKHQKRLRATLSPYTTLLAAELSQDRFFCRQLLQKAELPVPEQHLFYSLSEIHRFLNEKDNNEEFIFTERIRRKTEISGVIIPEMYDVEKKFQVFSNETELLLTKFSLQENFRQIYKCLVLNGNCIAVSRVEVPSVAGDGQTTINELIRNLNMQNSRQKGDKGNLSIVEKDEETRLLLSSAYMELDDILPQDKVQILKVNPNPGNGSFTYTQSFIHPSHKGFIEKAVKITGLDLATVTYWSKDITEPFQQNSSLILEVFAAPDFRTFIHPFQGEPAQVVEKYFEYIFQDSKQTHIPLISVTGSNGKTTCCELLGQCFSDLGYFTGKFSGGKLSMGKNQNTESEISYFEAVELIEKDIDTEIAIIESPVEEILKSGLAYAYTDFGIILNIYPKHLNENDIRYEEDIAYAKSVVAETVRENGYSILNADDELVMEMTNRTDACIALFSCKPEQSHVQKHLKDGKPLALFTNESLKIFNFSKEIFEIPIPMDFQWIQNGKLLDSFMAAVLCLYLFGLSPDIILKSITEYNPELQ